MVSRQQLLFKILKADSHLLIQDNQVIKQVRGLIDISVPIPSHSLQDCLNGLLPHFLGYLRHTLGKESGSSNGLKEVETVLESEGIFSIYATIPDGFSHI